MDDFLVIGSGDRMEEFIANISKKLCISSNAELSRYIGIDVTKHPDGGFFLSQSSASRNALQNMVLATQSPLQRLAIQIFIQMMESQMKGSIFRIIGQQ